MIGGMEIRYCNTRAQFAEAFAAVRRLSPWRSLAPMLLGIAFMAGVVISAYFRGTGEGFERWLDGFIKLGILTGLALCFLFYGFVAHRVQRDTNWKKSPHLAQEQFVVIDDSGLTYARNEVQAKWEWKAITRWFQTPNLVVICIQQNFIFLPKGAILDASELIATLTRNCATTAAGNR